ncbi:MAG: methyltransferase domain-containing protein [Planctomycetales bacterium]|nr:methyltransferase domain-containing protein [Planctomycetales bacterium]
MGNLDLPILNNDDRPLDVESAVRDRYSSASKQAEPSLCCPVDYDPKYLKVLPQELIERDYGCGDPSKWLHEGETVLDLGSGGGKICYIASQVVGEHGKVYGVDMNDEMLTLARKYQQEIAQSIGYDNVTFFKGRIQDLALDLDNFESFLQENPAQTAAGWLAAETHARNLRATAPMIADDSVDVIVSNCVLNLVAQFDRQQLFSEMFRVLRRGGRAVISDIVCDEPVPLAMQNDPTLWSGCISGAYVESEFLDAFADAGFYGMELVDRPTEPWATVNGIEFRSVTVQAFKGKEGPCVDYNEAVIYRGPWKQVVDDDGHVLSRGVPSAVCRKNFEIYTNPPYANQFLAVPPRTPVADSNAKPFDCRAGKIRSPEETKGEAFCETKMPDNTCCGGGEC